MRSNYSFKGDNMKIKILLFFALLLVSGCKQGGELLAGSGRLGDSSDNPR